MKLFLRIIIFIFIFVSINTKISFAQAPNFMVSAPGLDCGFADDNTKDKCCVGNQNVSFKPPSVNILFDTVSGILSGLTNSLVKPLIQPIYNIQQQVLKPCYNGTPSYNGVPSTFDPNKPDCKCINTVTPTPGALSSLISFCKQIQSNSEQTLCSQCVTNGGVWTSIGCVYSDLRRFITDVLLGFGISFAGLIAILCIIYSAFQIQTSQGDPEKIKKAQQLLTSCITGLILIIFSIFILRLIGVNILKIPFFT